MNRKIKISNIYNKNWNLPQITNIYLMSYNVYPTQYTSFYNEMHWKNVITPKGANGS